MLCRRVALQHVFDGQLVMPHVRGAFWRLLYGHGHRFPYRGAGREEICPRPLAPRVQKADGLPHVVAPGLDGFAIAPPTKLAAARARPRRSCEISTSARARSLRRFPTSRALPSRGHSCMPGAEVVQNHSFPSCRHQRAQHMASNVSGAPGLTLSCPSLQPTPTPAASFPISTSPNFYSRVRNPAASPANRGRPHTAPRPWPPPRPMQPCSVHMQELEPCHANEPTARHSEATAANQRRYAGGLNIRSHRGAQ